MKYTLIVTLIVLLFADFVFALPIDWSGSLGYDTNSFSNFRKTTDEVDSTDVGGLSTAVTDGDDSAVFQTYVFKLNPTILVNDAASIKGELSTGYMRGNLIGDTTRTGAGSNQSYYFTTANGSANSLNVNQLYLELYADTAVYKIGKFAKGYGLGVVFDDGTDKWDRFFTLYDGLEAQFKIGNFRADVLWSKLSTVGDGSNGSLNAAQASGTNDVTEKGITAMYDNPNKNLKAGVYYGIRDVNSTTSLYNGNASAAGAGSNNFDGGGQVKIIDIFFEKIWGKFTMAMEIPMVSGTVGEIYAGEGDTDIDTNAFILESEYKSSEKTIYSFDAGLVKGDDGSTDSFEGFYLNPNYKIARILYQFNYNGFNGNNNIYDVAIANSKYFKLMTTLDRDTWVWDFSFIWAQAQVTAADGEDYYNHTTGSWGEASEDQSADLGWEFDIDFRYRWNPQIQIGGYFAYLRTGEHFAFTDDSDTLALENVIATGLNVAVEF